MTTKIMQQKDILKCKICQNTVQEPKRLNCYHSFCKNCIATLPRITSKTENGLQCPVCAVFTAENHVKDNLILIELLDMQHNKESDTKHACEQCLEVDSEWKCLDCKIKLCKKCHSNHVRIPLLRGHRVLPLDAETEMMIDRLVFCSKHNDQPIVFNCGDCEVLLCINCKVTQHESHKTETVEDTLKRILPEVSRCVEEVKQHISNISENKGELQSTMDEVKTAFAKARTNNKRNMEKNSASKRTTERGCRGPQCKGTTGIAKTEVLEG